MAYDSSRPLDDFLTCPSKSPLLMLVSSSSADSYAHILMPLLILVASVYVDAESGDGKADVDSGSDGDAYYHYAPVLSVFLELVFCI